MLQLIVTGAAESGKSTLLKQMRILHDNGFTIEEAMSRKNLVYTNTVDAMYYILCAMHKLKIPFTQQSCSEHCRLIYRIRNEDSLDEIDLTKPDIYLALKELWQDLGVKQAFERRGEYYVPDCGQHFLDDLDRIAQDGYCPNTQDLLFVRIPTIGVHEVCFRIKERIWRVYDVGGQRAQRRKWIHCFDDVQSLLFITGISEFDQVLAEDETTNRICESLQLFKQVINNRYFHKSSVILFLNKIDLFEQKLKSGRSIRTVFERYKGADTFEESANYIKERFVRINEVTNREIYCHYTCATDTTQIENIVNSSMDTIISTNATTSGLS